VSAAPARAPSPARTARRIALATFLLYAFSAGGRIVGSDEVTMLDLARALLRGRIAVPAGATLDGHDGRHYTKNAAAQAIAALPLTALAEGAAGAARLAEPRRTLAVRFGVSFFNALVTAALLGVFYATTRALGAGPGAGFLATLLLGFTTPLWVYAKSFMAEPLEALGLLLALAGAARAASDARGARLAGLGVFIAVAAKLSMLPIALAALLPLAAAPRRAWWPALLGLGAALAGHLAYDFARFGNLFETGYGAQASPAAWTTPLPVGLYGLLLSSGKGVVWFAPVLLLLGLGARGPGGPAPAGAGWRARLAAAPPWARARVGAIAAGLVGLLLYAGFQHWAGDGSFGPRYLIPLLPLAFLVVAGVIDRAGTRARGAIAALGTLGLLVQLGGVGIYFGAQMREAGDYPYTLPLDHPRFMSDSHFNPAFSPIVGHWRMLLRNAGEHLRGAWPRVAVGEGADARLEVGEEDQRRLLHGLDFWWCYLLYAGLPAGPVLGAAAALLVAGIAMLARARAAARAEMAAG